MNVREGLRLSCSHSEGRPMYKYLEVLYTQVRVLETLVRGNRVDVRDRIVYTNFPEFLR